MPKKLNAETLAVAANVASQSEENSETTNKLQRMLEVVLDQQVKEVEAEKDRLLAKNKMRQRLSEELAEQQNFEQRFCTHKKENGKSRVNGQSFSDGRNGYICQYCQKMWFEPVKEGEDTLPLELRPIGDHYGSVRV